LGVGFEEGDDGDEGFGEFDADVGYTVFGHFDESAVEVLCEVLSGEVKGAFGAEEEEEFAHGEGVGLG